MPWVVVLWPQDKTLVLCVVQARKLIVPRCVIHLCISITFICPNLIQAITRIHIYNYLQVA